MGGGDLKKQRAEPTMRRENSSGGATEKDRNRLGSVLDEASATTRSWSESAKEGIREVAGSAVKTSATKVVIGGVLHCCIVV